MARVKFFSRVYHVDEKLPELEETVIIFDKRLVSFYEAFYEVDNNWSGWCDGWEHDFELDDFPYWVRVTDKELDDNG